MEIHEGLSALIKVISFSVEDPEYDDDEIVYTDYLTVNGVRYHGSTGPSDVTPTTSITWTSNSDVGGSGWKLCAAITEECQDLVPDGETEWYSSDGPTKNCEYFASKSNYCDRWGDDNENFNMTANQACCTCGGGTPAQIIVDGDCTTSDGCVRSANYPSSYGSDERCTIFFDQASVSLTPTSFVTEAFNDALEVDGANYSGEGGWTGDDPFEVTSSIIWESDGSAENAGWEFCVTTR